MADRCRVTFRLHVAATLMLTLRDTAERCPTYVKLAEVSPVSKAQVERVGTLAASADVCKALVGVG
jgi:hypothetical protein